jgi:hypothetical protein
VVRQQGQTPLSHPHFPAAMIAWAAESRAIGTRNGEHDT